MKKILASWFALVLLSSCGTTSFDTPEQALLENQNQIVEKLEKISDLTPTQANSTGKMDFSIESSDLNLATIMSYNFDANQETWDTSGNMEISMNGNVDENMGLPVSNFAGKLNFDLVALKNKLFFKINNLEISQPAEDPAVAMISQYTNAYLEKWYFLEDALNATQGANMNMIQFQNEFIEVLKNQRLFNHVSTNENENFYDYEVDLNPETLVNITKKVNNLSSSNTENELTQEDFDYIRKDIQTLNETTQMNIKISKDNVEHFILSVTDENATFTLENNDTNIDVEVVDTISNMKFNFIGTKKINGISAEIKALQDDNQVLSGALNIVTDGKNTNLEFEATANSQGEEIKITMNLDDVTTQNKTEITAPENSVDFQEVIMEVMGMMMWGMPIWEEMSIQEDTSNQIEGELNEEINQQIAE